MARVAEANAEDEPVRQAAGPQACQWQPLVVVLTDLEPMRTPSPTYSSRSDCVLRHFLDPS
jgi:hypothetical protein